MNIKFITVQEVEYIAVSLAQKWMTFNEPIPHHSTRFPNRLESCILTPQQSFGGEGLYKGLVGKASMLFYLMNKNHPFQNGNKRIAMTSLMLLLYKNNYWIKVDNEALYKFAMWVVQSPNEAKNETEKAIKNFIGKYLIKIPPRIENLKSENEEQMKRNAEQEAYRREGKEINK
ncbi:MAG: type II toxin-antitoxin system death-on-curing family toxin [Elusimicrobia bacterium]|nr:type II toxin-antitoxin system death-on-curing family toxin [Elusimicrobiota bacterium]